MIQRLTVLLAVVLAAAAFPTPSPAGEDTVIHEEWRGEYLGKDKIGYSYSTLESLPGDAAAETGDRYRLVSGVVIPSEKVRMKSRLRAELDDGLAVRLLRVEMEAQGSMVEAEGSVVDGNLVLRVASSGAVSERVLPADGPIYVGDVIPWIIIRRGMEPGAEASFLVFDPTVLATGPMTVKIGEWKEWEGHGGPVRALHVTAAYMGIPMDLWIGEKGELLETRTDIMNIRSVRESRESLESADDFADVDQANLINEASIPSDRKIPEPEDVTSLTVELEGLPEGMELPDDSWQRVVSRDDGKLTLRVGLAAAGEGAPELSPEALEAALEPSILVQSDDPRIREKAAGIVGDATDPDDKAHRIADWVSRGMQSELRVSTPSAVEILESLRGDCNEYATLFAALARAAGVPAKIAAGIVYQDGRFFYHAWNEVALPGRGWVPVDTTFGEFPADPTHIKFAEGDLEEHILIARLVGKVELKVLKIEPAEEPTGE